MSKYKVKIICGFRHDQEFTIDANEAHKAYYLFLHPEKRGIFHSGLALCGSDIKEIVPDYQGSMGWNPSHVLDADDWNEIKEKNMDVKLRNILASAKAIATKAQVSEMAQPLSFLLREKYPILDNPDKAGRNE